MHAEYETLMTPCCSGIETFIYFLTFSLSTRNFYYADCSYIAHSWIARPRVKSALTAFFKNHQIRSPSLPGMTSFTPQSHFLSGVFIMTFVIVISSVHECDLYSMCAPALIAE